MDLVYKQYSSKCFASLFHQHHRKCREDAGKPPFEFHLNESCLTYLDFFHWYLMPNKPCVFPKCYTEKWTARKEWVDQYGKPDFLLLRTKFGEATVPVANCRQELYSSHTKEDIKFVDYIKYWEDYITSGYADSKECLYMKDWHFTRVFPEYEAYKTPKYFASDWLNEFWDTRNDDCDDYRFVYMGPKGSWTPFHADVFRSYSWSANICGRKKWILFPPGEEEYLKDKYGHLVYDVTSDDLKNPELYPKYSQLQHKIEIIQEAGEIIFVPSGWHHQEDTISINHNWLNGCNVDICWSYIKQCLCEVQQEIADCKDMEGWHQQCQMILKASSGIDFTEFFTFMKVIAQTRLDILEMKQKKSVQEFGATTDLKCTYCHNDEIKSTDVTEKVTDLPPIEERKDIRQKITVITGTDLPPLDESQTTLKEIIQKSSVVTSTDLSPLDESQRTLKDIGQQSSLVTSAKIINSNHLSNNENILKDINTDVLNQRSDSGENSLIEDSCTYAGSVDRTNTSDNTMIYPEGFDSLEYFNHLKFDLYRVAYILEDMLKTPEFLLINSLESDAVDLLTSIQAVDINDLF